MKSNLYVCGRNLGNFSTVASSSEFVNAGRLENKFFKKIFQVDGTILGAVDQDGTLLMGSDLSEIIVENADEVYAVEHVGYKRLDILGWRKGNELYSYSSTGVATLVANQVAESYNVALYKDFNGNTVLNDSGTIRYLDIELKEAAPRINKNIYVAVSAGNKLVVISSITGSVIELVDCKHLLNTQVQSSGDRYDVYYVLPNDRVGHYVISNSSATGISWQYSSISTNVLNVPDGATVVKLLSATNHIYRLATGPSILACAVCVTSDGNTYSAGIPIPSNISIDSITYLGVTPWSTTITRNTMVACTNLIPFTVNFFNRDRETIYTSTLTLPTVSSYLTVENDLATLTLTDQTGQRVTTAIKIDPYSDGISFVGFTPDIDGEVPQIEKGSQPCYLQTTTNLYPVYAETLPDDAVHLVLYNNYSDRRKIEKTLENPIDVVGVFRDEVDLIRPTVYLFIKTVPDANYAYLRDFRRYYFITGITAVNKDLYRIEMAVDVLMSYKEDLTSTATSPDAVISRVGATELADPYLTDSALPITSQRNIEVVEGTTRPFIDNDDIEGVNYGRLRFRYVVTVGTGLPTVTMQKEEEE